ncbi:phage holin family protein [Nocardia sp. NPDC050712]|uniref:phage holin family protein n=1 Tax=Nocardia sp. NPDC050712 TaxID=3155518 RepID=UPI0033D9D715
MNSTAYQRNSADNPVRLRDRARAEVVAQARARWRVIRRDLVRRGKVLAAGALLLSAAVIALLAGVWTGVGFAVESLAQWVPHWAALLVTSVTLFGAAGVVAALGASLLGRSARRRVPVRRDPGR